MMLFASIGSPATASLVEVIEQTQPKIVKVYGVGGFRGLENYQSGFLISPNGHILTAHSYVLDTDYITVVLDDGRRFDAKLLGADPRLEIAILKIEASGLAHFDLAKSATAEAGARVLAFSNLFGIAVGNEPASVQKGTVSVVTRLDARRGTFETLYRGPVYVLDVATNNPGAAGGALTNARGELIGMLGKELRNALNHTWLSYAIPIAEMRTAIDELQTGKFLARQASEDFKKPRHSVDPAALGIVLVPDVLERTPPYIDQVRPGSPAAKANLRSDDLILYVGDRLVPSCKALVSELELIDREDAVRLTVQRGQELFEFVLRLNGNTESSTQEPHRHE